MHFRSNHNAAPKNDRAEPSESMEVSKREDDASSGHGKLASSKRLTDDPGNLRIRDGQRLSMVPRIPDMDCTILPWVHRPRPKRTRPMNFFPCYRFRFSQKSQRTDEAVNDRSMTKPGSLLTRHRVCNWVISEVRKCIRNIRQ